MIEGNKLVPISPFISPIGGWRLNLAADGAFTNNLTDESVFSIKNDANDNGGNNGALAYMFSTPTLGGRGLVRLSPISYNLQSWRCDDKRRTLLLTQDGRSYYTTKYKDITNRTDASPQIRYAEILLTLSEAEPKCCRGEFRALDLLNAVRNGHLPTTHRKPIP